MRMEKILNQLLTVCAAQANQRGLPDVGTVLKQAAITIGKAIETDATDELLAMTKAFEAKIVAQGEITAEDLVMESVPDAPEPEATTAEAPPLVVEGEAFPVSDEDFINSESPAE